MHKSNSAASTKTRIFLIRHGQTKLNTKDIVRGCLDIPLDKTGFQQAAQLGQMLRWQSLDRIVSGPLLRARQTAESIAAAAAVQIEVNEALRDRDYGPWTGRPREEVAAAFGHADNAPDIEPFAPFAKRVSDALRRIAGTSIPGENVAVVAHKAVNRAVLLSLFPTHFRDTLSISQRIGCWNLCEYDQTGWAIRVLDALPVSSNSAFAYEKGATGLGNILEDEDLSDTPLWL